jgi:hypothetical protein
VNVSFTPRLLYPGERTHGNRWVGGWVGIRTGLDKMEMRKTLPPLRFELPSFSLPLFRQSLYRLRIHGMLFVLSQILFTQSRRKSFTVHLGHLLSVPFESPFHWSLHNRCVGERLVKQSEDRIQHRKGNVIIILKGFRGPCKEFIR